MAKKRKLHSQKHGSNEVDSFMESTNEETMEVHNEETNDTHEIEAAANDQQLEQSDTQSEPQNIGHFLRTAREAKGLTLQHIAHVTKISLKNLKYLEEGAIELLPDKIYVFGYVKNYTKVLTINHTEALKLLESEYAKLSPPQYSAPEPVVPKNAVSAVDSLGDGDKQNYLIIGLIALVVIVISSILFFSSGSDSDSKEMKDGDKVIEVQPSENPKDIDIKESITPMSLSSQTPLQKEIEEIPENSELKTSDLKEDTLVEKILETKPIATEEKKPIEKKEEVKKVENKKSDNDKLVSRKFYQISIPLYESLVPEAGEEYSDLVPADINQKHSDDLQNIFVYAKGGSSWVTYQTEDSKISQRYLKSGSYTFVRGKEIRMAIGNTGTARVFLNKEPIKLLTTTGVKNLVIPQENSNKYRMPLFVYNKDKNSFLTSEQYMKRLEEQEEQEKQEEQSVSE